jgi:hypothetical protein
MPVAPGLVDVLPDPDAATIAFIGDSFVEGYYVPYEKSFVHLAAIIHDCRMILGGERYRPG